MSMEMRHRVLKTNKRTKLLKLANFDEETKSIVIFLYNFEGTDYKIVTQYTYKDYISTYHA